MSDIIAIILSILTILMVAFDAVVHAQLVRLDRRLARIERAVGREGRDKASGTAEDADDEWWRRGEPAPGE